MNETGWRSTKAKQEDVTDVSVSRSQIRGLAAAITPWNITEAVVVQQHFLFQSVIPFENVTIAPYKNRGGACTHEEE